MRVYLPFLLVAALGCASAPPARDGQAPHVISPTSEPPIASPSQTHGPALRLSLDKIFQAEPATVLLKIEVEPHQANIQLVHGYAKCIPNRVEYGLPTCDLEDENEFLRKSFVQLDGLYAPRRFFHAWEAPPRHLWAGEYLAFAELWRKEDGKLERVALITVPFTILESVAGAGRRIGV